MISIIVHGLIGLAIIGWIIASNQQVYAKPANGPWFSLLEYVYYFVGIASIALGYYFNIQFMADAHGQGNLFAGPASYPHFVRMLFTNPAAGSGSEDYLITNVILLPLFTIIDGYRRGLRRPWLFFVLSDFTSLSFAFAFYFATMERQRRHERARETVPKIDA
jgi:hypothetical protein